MTRTAVALCALELAGLALGATPAEEFTARRKELLANKEARGDAERLHRLLEISWEYTMKESPEFATYIGYPGQNDRWTDMSFEAIERRKETDKLDFELIKSIDRTLGYKIGQLKIRELRGHAEKELGQKFDLRAFHDEVLENGALPMSVLEIHLKEWVAKAKTA